MGASAKLQIEEVGTCTGDRATSSAQMHVTETASTSGLESPPLESRSGIRVRYGETEAGLIGRASVSTTDIRPYGIGSMDDQIDVWISRCKDLLDRLIDSEDIIERENLYRTLDEYLNILFGLRRDRERAFGHLLVLLMGVTRHTTSEFFSNKQFSALKRSMDLITRPKLAESDLREARRTLSGAGFDLFRPLRDVFKDE